VPELQLVICHMAWIGSCQHQAFGAEHRGRLAYVNPIFYERLWSLVGKPRGKQAPSTGILAIALALGMCGRVTLFGFGKAGARADKVCRHYWECPRWEDEAKYYDPEHSFHDWLAEERLRTLWTRARLVTDGHAAPSAASTPTPTPRNTSASRWAAFRPAWKQSQEALRRWRDSPSRRKRAKGKGKGARGQEWTSVDDLIHQWAPDAAAAAGPTDDASSTTLPSTGTVVSGAQTDANPYE
jgi:hypothetical protein